MPAIQLFNRKWMIGSDDFVYSIAGENLFRVLWFIFLVLVFFLDIDMIYHPECEHRRLLQVYYYGMFTIQSFMILYNFLVMKKSMQGDIMDVLNKRAMVPFLVTGKVLLLFLEGAWAIVGTYFLCRYDFEKCSRQVVLSLKSVIILYWVFFSVLLFFVFFAFDPMGSPMQQQGFNAAASTWRKRCKRCFCVPPGRDSTNLNSIANIFADYFYKTDLVMSDILAGLLLVHHEQASRQYNNLHLLLSYKQPDPKTSETPPALTDSASNQDQNFKYPPADYTPPADWMSLENASYFLRFAAASYGNYCRILACLCYKALCPYCKPERCCSSRGPMHGDCCMSCSIVRHTGVARKDFLYADFESRAFESPFYVLLDHKTTSIVISIRGTLSLEDTITDLTVEALDMNLKMFRKELAHGGMLRTAINIQQTLLQEQPIEKARLKYPVGVLRNVIF